MLSRTDEQLNTANMVVKQDEPCIGMKFANQTITVYIDTNAWVNKTSKGEGNNKPWLSRVRGNPP